MVVALHGIPGSRAYRIIPSFSDRAFSSTLDAINEGVKAPFQISRFATDPGLVIAEVVLKLVKFSDELSLLPLLSTANPVKHFFPRNRCSYGLAVKDTPSISFGN